MRLVCCVVWGGGGDDPGCERSAVRVQSTSASAAFTSSLYVDVVRHDRASLVESCCTVCGASSSLLDCAVYTLTSAQRQVRESSTYLQNVNLCPTSLNNWLSAFFEQMFKSIVQKTQSLAFIKLHFLSPSSNPYCYSYWWTVLRGRMSKAMLSFQLLSSIFFSPYTF